MAVELVANPAGQKGGHWVSLRTNGRSFLVEGLNTKAGRWPDFLERHRGAPYNAFRNIYDARRLREVLLGKSLPTHLRVREAQPEGPEGWSSGETRQLGLYLESVTGDITQIPETSAAAFRASEAEEIHDLKELKDLPRAMQFIALQDQNEEFRGEAGLQ